MEHTPTSELLKQLLELHEEMYFTTKAEHSELDCELIEEIKCLLVNYE